jgi:hypothetical protein
MAFTKRHTKLDLPKHHGQWRHVNKALVLLAENTPDSRAAYKAMGVHKYPYKKPKLNGFFHPNGHQPLRCKEKNK